MRTTDSAIKETEYLIAENQPNNRPVPEGYMTGEEFWRLIRENINKWQQSHQFIPPQHYPTA